MSIHSKVHKDDECKCNWGTECSKAQQEIAVDCFKTGKNHPLLGYVHIQPNAKSLVA